MNGGCLNTFGGGEKHRWLFKNSGGSFWCGAAAVSLTPSASSEQPRFPPGETATVAAAKQRKRSSSEGGQQQRLNGDLPPRCIGDSAEETAATVMFEVRRRSGDGAVTACSRRGRKCCWGKSTDLGFLLLRIYGNWGNFVKESEGGGSTERVEYTGIT